MAVLIGGTSANVHYQRTANLPSMAAFTITAWVNFNTAVGDYRCLWSFEENGTTASAWIAESGTGGNTLSGTTPGDGSPPLLLGTMTVGTWYYLGVSVNGSTVNAISKVAGAGTFTTRPADTVVQTSVKPNIIRIGNSVFLTDYLRGSVAGVKIWTGVALTNAEMQAEAAQFAPVRTDGLYAFYRFKDAATATQDSSGLGNHLTGGTGATDMTDPTGVLEGGGPVTLIRGWGPVPVI
jgi:hypothetical protein